MPRTTEIPREKWQRALDEFSAIHEGWLISLDVLSDTFGAQPEITNLPLVGVTFEAVWCTRCVSSRDFDPDHNA